MRKRKAKNLTKQLELLCPGHLDALRPMLEAANEVCADSHALQGREAWDLLWACLAHEINVMGTRKDAPDRTRFDATQVEAIKSFANMLAQELAVEPLDYAGTIFMGLSFNNSVQIFTPREIVDYMVGSVIEDKLKNGDPIGGLAFPWLDPCVGGGAFPLGVLRATKKYGIEKPIWMVMNDLDLTCCDMAFVQYSYAGGLGEMHRGDFLRTRDIREYPITHISLPSKYFMLAG